MAGSLGSSAAVTRRGRVAGGCLTMVAYLIGIAGYAVLIPRRSPAGTGPA